LRVLLSAYACEPARGSEPGVGWNWVQEIARFHDVWVITRANNRDAIDRVSAKRGSTPVKWVYFDLPCWARFWKKGSRGLRLYYFLWQLGAYFVSRRLNQRVHFEAVHHLTFGTYWLPSFLSLLPVPFFWGPVGGAESAPRLLRKSLGLKGRIYELLRDVGRAVGNVNPLVRMNARRAVLVLSKTMDTKRCLESLGAQRVVVCSEVGLTAAEIYSMRSFPVRDGAPFRLLSIGRLIHWKGFAFGLKAFAQFHRQFPGSDYWIIGDGPERKPLERLAQQLGVSESLRFLGSLQRAQVLEKLLECDVLVHPSLHDSGGWVCVEAMAAGRPVICLDLGGPATQVTDRTGIKVPAGPATQVVQDLALAMAELAQNRSYRELLGKKAQERVQECFRWEMKGEWIDRVYLSIQ
jgi:glycosyltransferase involved in cell wall biosynthesis